MSDYRPICDTWILARPKVKYYGAYPSGFLGRARALFNLAPSEPLLHACSGMVRDYPFAGLGTNDKTLDLDPELKPDFCQDARDPWPLLEAWRSDGSRVEIPWPGILIDPPYSPEDATRYAPGKEAYPEPRELLKRAWEVLGAGRRVGILHYVWARPPKDAKLVAAVHVLMGYDNRSRVFAVYEKPGRS